MDPVRAKRGAPFATGSRVPSVAMVDEDIAEAAADAVDADEVLAFARALIAAPSENPGGTEDEAAAVATDILTAMGASPETIRGDEGRPSVVASIGSGNGPRSPGTATSMSFPSATRRTGATVRGKGGRGRPVDRTRIRRHERAGRVGARRRGRAPTSGHRAGGNADVPPGRRRGAHGPVRDEGAAGPRDARRRTPASSASRATCGSGLAERGGAWITATARGQGAHGSQPNLGVNAITSMARLAAPAAGGVPDREHPLVGRPSVNAAVITGAARRTWSRIGASS